MSLTMVLPGCAPLNPTNTAMEDVGEVTLRTVLFPLTLGTSELMIADQRKREAEAPRYYGSGGGGSSDAALMGLAIMPPLFTPPAPAAVPTYQPTRMPSCWTTQSGPAYYTNCY